MTTDLAMGLVLVMFVLFAVPALGVAFYELWSMSSLREKLAARRRQNEWDDTYEAIRRLREVER